MHASWLLAAATALNGAGPQAGPRSCSRRAAVGFAGLACAATSRPRPADAAPFEWGFLYKAGPPSAPKQRSLPPSELASILQRDLAEKKYILTGDLTPSIFADDCRFVDPNNAVDGLAKYQQALSLLFKPELSALEDVQVSVGEGRTIVADYTATGELKLPWHPRIAPWRGHITWTLGTDGLIASQVDVWNITRWDAIRQTFTPG